jgi:N-dimethylarginine dimethylaminohydrolase
MVQQAAVRYGGQSMTAPLRRVMVRRPAAPESADDWRGFNYVHPIDHAKTEREHEALTAILSDAGIDVVEAGPDEAGYLDAIFPYDPSLMTDHGAILLRMGKPARLDETAFHARTYGELGIPILGAIEAPGTVEGGDTLWLDEGTLAVGRGYRTNAAGIEQLRAVLASIGVETLAYDLPHWTGPQACLHLMSLISPVDERLAVAYPRLMATAFVQELGRRDWRLIEVPDGEYDSMGCNVLALAPRRVLALEGNPETKRRMEGAGCEVRTYKGEQISRNREGGPTCLTRPILRTREGTA